MMENREKCMCSPNRVAAPRALQGAAKIDSPEGHVISLFLNKIFQFQRGPSAGGVEAPFFLFGFSISLNVCHLHARRS
jgi:hypothetical protein